MNNEIKEILEDNGELMVRYKDDSFECFDTLPKNVLDYITNLQQRIDKAIEYINFLTNHYKEQLSTPIEDTYFDNDTNRKGYILSIIACLTTLLDILQGSDKE